MMYQNPSHYQSSKRLDILAFEMYSLGWVNNEEVFLWRILDMDV